MKHQPIYTVVRDPEGLQQALLVRGIVFVEEQQVPYTEEVDGLDAVATHFLATVDGEPVGTARIRVLEKYIKIERLAVRKAYRGLGIGRGVFGFVLEHIARLTEQAGGAERKKIVLHAQAYLVDFYADFGFVRHGELFQEANIDHYYMERAAT